MFIVWGSRLYGKTDEIPGLGHVATKFGHLYYLPLIPVESHFVISHGEEGWQGAPLGVSIKSIMIAWLRAGLWAASVVTLFYVMAVMTDVAGMQSREFTISAAILFVLLATLIATYFMKIFTRASYDRARTIADAVGFSAEAHVIIDMVYGVISEREAERLFDKLAEDGQDVFAGQDQFALHTDQ